MAHSKIALHLKHQFYVSVYNLFEDLFWIHFAVN